MIDRLKRAWAKRGDDDGRYDVDIAPEVADVDAARDYDVDLGICDRETFGRALFAGIPLREHGTRTGRLTHAELDTLGLGVLQRELSNIAGHGVQIVLVQDKRQLRRLGLNVLVPPAPQ